MPRVSKDSVVAKPSVDVLQPASTTRDKNGSTAVLIEVPLDNRTISPSRRHIDLDLPADVAAPLIRLANALRAKGVIINGRPVEGTTSAARWLFYQIKLASEES